MKSSLILVMAFLCLHLTSKSQNITALSIGDTIPDITLNNILNYKSRSARLSEFKNRPVIIDFFATWCSSCIAALPHLDSLQREFGDSIQIFVVTKESAQKMTPFLSKNKIAALTLLPYVSGDTTLRKYFRHKMIPHEIIIRNRKIEAITYPEFITSSALCHLLNTGTIKLPIKNDMFEFDRKKSLFENNIGRPLDMAVCQFLLTKNISGLGGQSGTIFSQDSSRKRIFYTNHPLLYYIQLATNFREHFNRIILDVPNASKYIRKNENWILWGQDNNYSLEAIVPTSWNEQRVKDWLIQEFNTCLGLYIGVKIKKVRCWVLKTMPSKKNVKEVLPSHPPKNTSHVQSTNGLPKQYTYNSIPELIKALNYQTVARPIRPIVLDETGDTARVKIRIEVKNIQNLKEIAKALEKYGMTLTPTVRNIEMLVIKEKTE